MPVRDERQRLQDILDHIAEIDAHVAGLSFDQFAADRRTNHAVRYCIGIIGEAARAVPESITAQYPAVPWKEIMAMRNFLFHVYWATDDKVLWDTVNADLDPLKYQVVAILAELGE